MEKTRSLFFEQCKKRIAGHPKKTMREDLLGVANSLNPDAVGDFYGQGEGLQAFETEIAELLGKESAVFMPSGTMAQQIALRCWADRSEKYDVALHLTSHLCVHEENAFQILHPIVGEMLGEFDKPLSLKNLKSTNTKFGSIILELPQRHSAGLLQTWEELVEIREWCNSKDIKLHLDGARLWEAQVYYERPFREITQIFDSVYVSFYKGLGGVGGAMLVGDATFITESRVWLRRHGGNLFHLYPIYESARLGYKTRLCKMQSYFEKAERISRIIRECSEIEVFPEKIMTNMFHLSFKHSQLKVEEALFLTARKTGVVIGKQLWVRPFGSEAVLELSIGDAALEMSDTEIIEVFGVLNSELKKQALRKN